MALNIHNARVAGPVAPTKTSGRRETIPLGLCFVEETDEDSFVIFWGSSGERSAELTLKEAALAIDEGNLVLLD